MMQQVRVRVPATSANLGPGFDCLGAALALHNVVTVSRGGLSACSSMVAEAAEAFFAAAGSESFEFSWTVAGDIPRSRGLGSSVAVRLGILHGLNELAGAPLDARTLYQLCARLEGHPDNAAPAAFGGFAAARADGEFFRCPIPPALRFVVLIPAGEIETDASRGTLPATVPHADAARSAANAALIAAAFASGEFGHLRGSLRDWLHEPYREAANPHLRPSVAAGVAAGALGGYLSGSGSAVACITMEDAAAAVASAMHSVLPEAAVRVLPADNTGTVILA
jgi:homoserine kinase